MKSSRSRFIRGLCTSALFLVFVLLSKDGLSQRKDLRWVGLYNVEMLAWLENENQMARLCPNTLSPEEKRACEAKNRRPKTWEIGVFTSPSTGAERIGKILMTAIPGSPLMAAFQGADASTPIPFQPDLYLEDWGYGPYFHQTVLDQRGPWFLLPKNPLPVPAWINLNDISKDFHIQSFEVGVIYELDGESIVVVTFTQSGILVRAEQPADMWCQEGDPPPLEPAETKEIKYQDLFDKNGHLKMTVKYMKGC
ncbi:MAG: hypothetical protein KKE57_10305 [Proteobacteria bacterium]|nr:hypothetical protein [Pseudomonadota bacterium]